MRKRMVVVYFDQTDRYRDGTEISICLVEKYENFNRFENERVL